MIRFIIVWGSFSNNKSKGSILVYRYFLSPPKNPPLPSKHQKSEQQLLSPTKKIEGRRLFDGGSVVRSAVHFDSDNWTATVRLGTGHLPLQPNYSCRKIQVCNKYEHWYIICIRIYINLVVILHGVTWKLVVFS